MRRRNAVNMNGKEIVAAVARAVLATALIAGGTAAGLFIYDRYIRKS